MRSSPYVSSQMEISADRMAYMASSARVETPIFW